MKIFIVEYNIWKRKENLENTKEAMTKFEKRLITEVSKQEKLEIAKKSNFRREKSPEKFIVKILCKQDNRKFEKKILKKLERNCQSCEQ